MKLMKKGYWVPAPQTVLIVFGIVLLLFGSSFLINSIGNLFRPKSTVPVGVYLVGFAILFMLAKRK